MYQDYCVASGDSLLILRKCVGKSNGASRPDLTPRGHFHGAFCGTAKSALCAGIALFVSAVLVCFLMMWLFFSLEKVLVSSRIF